MYVAVTFNSGQLHDISLCNDMLHLPTWRRRQQPALTPLDALMHDNQIVYLYQVSPNMQTNINLDDGMMRPAYSAPHKTATEAYFEAREQVTNFNELALLLIAFHFLIPPHVRAIASQLALRDEIHACIAEDLEFLFGPPVMRARVPQTYAGYFVATDLDCVLEVDHAQLNEGLLDRRRLHDTPQDHWGLISVMLMFAIPLYRDNITFPRNLHPWAAALYEEVTRHYYW